MLGAGIRIRQLIRFETLLFAWSCTSSQRVGHWHDQRILTRRWHYRVYKIFTMTSRLSTCQRPFRLPVSFADSRALIYRELEHWLWSARVTIAGSTRSICGHVVSEAGIVDIYWGTPAAQAGWTTDANHNQREGTQPLASPLTASTGITCHVFLPLASASHPGRVIECWREVNLSDVFI